MTEWARPTPASGWTIKHQVAHLIATFRIAGLAARDPAAFGVMTSRMSDDFDANVHATLNPFLGRRPRALVEKLRFELTAAADALAQVPADGLVPWLVRPVPPAVLAGAGMMELFGHGQDIADTVGVARRHTDRLAHLVGFAVRTWYFGYLARNLAVSNVEFRFAITSPHSLLWTFRPAGAGERIAGPAVDFCLLVTRRRHHQDLAITATGARARYWLEIAQAYRGPAGAGRMPGQVAA